MIRKIVPALSLLLILGGLIPATATAQPARFFLGYGLSQDKLNFSFAEMLNLKAVSVKRGQPYDETKDPTMRKGTENWEQEQGSFFTVPAVVLGIIGAFLFFNRK